MLTVNDVGTRTAGKKIAADRSHAHTHVHAGSIITSAAFSVESELSWLFGMEADWRCHFPFGVRVPFGVRWRSWNGKDATNLRDKRKNIICGLYFHCHHHHSIASVKRKGQEVTSLKLHLLVETTPFGKHHIVCQELVAAPDWLQLKFRHWCSMSV